MAAARRSSPASAPSPHRARSALSQTSGTAAFQLALRPRIALGASSSCASGHRPRALQPRATRRSFDGMRWLGSELRDGEAVSQFRLCACLPPHAAPGGHPNVGPEGTAYNASPRPTTIEALSAKPAAPRPFPNTFSYTSWYECSAPIWAARDSSYIYPRTVRPSINSRYVSQNSLFTEPARRARTVIRRIAVQGG